MNVHMTIETLPVDYSYYLYSTHVENTLDVAFSAFLIFNCCSLAISY